MKEKLIEPTLPLDIRLFYHFGYKFEGNFFYYLENQKARASFNVESFPGYLISGRQTYERNSYIFFFIFPVLEMNFYTSPVLENSIKKNHEEFFNNK